MLGPGYAGFVRCFSAGVLMIEADLRALDAPINVLDAGRLIDKTAHNMSPPRDVVQLVLEWVARNRGNNRYGK